VPIDGLWQVGIVEANYEFVRERLRQSIARINDRKARVISMIDESQLAGSQAQRHFPGPSPRPGWTGAAGFP
jgi:hypothetical protein